MAEDGVGAEGFGVASVDAREEGFGEVVNGFLAVVFADELGDGAFGGIGVRLREVFEAHFKLGSPAEQGTEGDGEELSGDHHHEPVGHGDEAATFDDIGDAEVIVGADDLVRQAHFVDKFEGGWLGGEEAIGAGFDDAPLDVISADDSAEGGVLFNQHSRLPGFGQFPGGG